MHRNGNHRISGLFQAFGILSVLVFTPLTLSAQPQAPTGYDHYLLATEEIGDTLGSIINTSLTNTSTLYKSAWQELKFLTANTPSINPTQSLASIGSTLDSISTSISTFWKNLFPVSSPVPTQPTTNVVTPKVVTPTIVPQPKPAVTITPTPAPKTATVIPATSITGIEIPPPSAPIVQNIILPTSSSSELNTKIEQLRNELLAKIGSLSARDDAHYQGNFQAIALTNKIDQLTNTVITNPTITGASITGGSISGATISGSLSVSSGTFSGNLTVSGTGTSTFAGDSAFDTDTLYIDSLNNRVGIATSSPSDTLALNGAAYFAQVSAPGVTTNRLYNDSGDLYWNGSLVGGGSVGNWTLSGSDVYRSSGNVGIGTTSPYAKLSVVGETVSSYFTATSTTATTTLNGGFTVSTSTFFVSPYNNRVGVGTADPVGTLDIGNGITIDSSNGSNGDASAVEIGGYTNSPFFSAGEYQNYLQYTEEFDQSVWTKTLIGTVSDGAYDPLGGIVADNIPAGSGSTASVSQTVTNSGTGNWTFSVWLRLRPTTGPATATISLRIDSSAETGTAKTINLTRAWKRYSVTQNFTAANTTKTAYITSGTTAITAFGAQLEPSATTRPYSGALTTTVVSNLTRKVRVPLSISVDRGVFATSYTDPESFSSYSAINATAGNNVAMWGVDIGGTSDYDVHGLRINTVDTGLNKIGNIRFSRNGSARWTIKKDDTAESGSSAGSLLTFQAHNDSGTTVGNAFALKRDLSAYFGGNVGIGTTSPYAKLSVVGETVSSYFTATSTTATTTFANHISIATGKSYRINGVPVVKMMPDAGNGESFFAGQNAGAANTTGFLNAFVGPLAGYSNTTGARNTFIGARAGYSTLSSVRNTFVGNDAGYSNTTGDQNVFIGAQAGYTNTTGVYNIAFGDGALFSNTTGNYNTATGYQSLYANTTASNNIAYGDYTLESNTTGSPNTAIGSAALRSNTTGYSNTAVGYQSLYSNITGYDNTAYGSALYSNTTGYENVAMGNSSLTQNTIGYKNTAVGKGALAANTTGYQNTALGLQALSGNITGAENTAVGINAGATYDNASTTFIGKGSGALSSGLVNATAVGYQAKVGASNSLVLGGTGTTAVNVGIGTTSPYAKLSVVGETVSSYFTATSTTATSTFEGRVIVNGTGLEDFSENGELLVLNAYNAINLSGAGNAFGHFRLRSDEESVRMVLDAGTKIGCTSGPACLATIAFAQSGNLRWGVRKTGATESGGNVGSNLQIESFDDSANHLGYPFIIERSTGNIAIGLSSATALPYARLDVRGSGSDTGQLFELSNSASTTLMRVLDNGTSYFYGNLGLGTTSPSAGLHVGSVASGKNVRIANGWLCVDDNDTCTGAATAGTVYAVGAYTTGADLAENYQAFEEGLTPGYIVSVTDTSTTATTTTDSFGVKKATPGETAIGIVSTKPGLLLANSLENTIPVALQGRVPLKVNGEGGVINPGDRITLSSTPGIGQKATSSSYTVAIALERFSGTTQGDTGIITAFVNLSYARLDPAVGDGTILSGNGESSFWSVEEGSGRIKFISQGIDLNDQDIVSVRAITGSAGKWSIDGNGRLVVGEVEANKVTTKTLCIDDVCIEKETLRALIERGGIQNGGASNEIPTVEDNSNTTPTYDSVPEVDVQPEEPPVEPSNEKVVQQAEPETTPTSEGEEESPTEPTPEPIEPAPAPETDSPPGDTPIQ